MRRPGASLGAATITAIPNFFCAASAGTTAAITIVTEIIGAKWFDGLLFNITCIEYVCIAANLIIGWLVGFYFTSRIQTGWRPNKMTAKA